MRHYFSILLILIAFGAQAQIQFKISITGSKNKGVQDVLVRISSKDRTANDQGSTDRNGKITFTSPLLVPGNTITISIVDIPPKLNYLPKEDVTFHLFGKEENDRNELTIKLRIPSTNDSVFVFGYVNDKENKPIEGIKISWDGSGISNSSSSGYYRLKISKSEVEKFAPDDNIRLQYNDSLGRFKSGYETVDFKTQNSIRKEKVLDKVPEKPPVTPETSKVYTLRLKPTGPEKHKKKIDISVVQNGRLYASDNGDLNSVTSIPLPTNMHVHDLILIKVKSEGLISNDTLLIDSMLDMIIELPLEKNIRISNFILEGIVGSDVSTNADFHAELSGAYLLKKKAAIGLHLSRVSVNDIIAEYKVFENTTLTMDTSMSLSAIGVYGNYYYYNLADNRKSNFFGTACAGMSFTNHSENHFIYSRMGLGYQYRVFPYLGISGSLGFSYYHLEMQSLQFNYFGNAERVPEKVNLFRFDLSLRLTYLIPQR